MKHLTKEEHETLFSLIVNKRKENPYLSTDQAIDELIDEAMPHPIVVFLFMLLFACFMTFGLARLRDGDWSEAIKAWSDCITLWNYIKP